MWSRKASLRFLLILSSLLLAPLALADNNDNYKSVTSPTMSSTNPRDYDYNGWRFQVAPYLWAVNMNGSVQVKGVRAPVSQTFSDILSDFNWGGMLWLDAYKDKWGVFVNAIYASLSQGASDRYISAHANDNFGLFSAGLSYEVYKKCFCSATCNPNAPAMTIEPYIGARYTLNNVSLTVNTPIGSLRRSNDKHWTDPFIGARLNFDLTKAWLITFAGDVGGTNASSDVSYNLIGVLAYKPQTMWTRTTWYLGYRYLSQLYTTGNSWNYFKWDMRLHGPMVGVGFAF